MKIKIYKILIFLSFIIISAAAYAADYKPSKKNYSILGDSQKEVYGQFDEYNKFNNIEAVEPSGSIVSPVSGEYNIYEPLPATVQEIAGQDLVNFLNNSVFGRTRYSRENWQKKDTVEVDKSSSTQTQQELPPGIKTTLPFESQLSLSGRKVIGVDFTSRMYDKEEDGKRKNTSSFKMDQELQMRILGSVGDRLNINVDYDDTADKKDISLVYKGQGNEFVREAAFGDISVSIPSTEFVGYSKELFGLKVDTKYKGLYTNAFFSKTKGSSEVKRFTGNTQLERKTIADTSYIKLKYYSILKPFETRTIKAGTAKVYLDYQRIDPKLNISITTTTPLNYLKLTVPEDYRGNFVLLVAGQDYTIDYNSGFITFKNSLVSNYVAAIDYQFTDDTWLSAGSGGNPLIFKDLNNTDLLSTELKTFYSLGNVKIVRDNGRDNFFLEVKDLNGDTPAVIYPNKPVPKYPNQSGYAANITVDFENGVFNLNPSSGTPMSDDLYTANTHRYNFVTEYQYIIKILTLRPDIVPQSERVVIDGLTLVSGTDYIIDYDLGILTILNEDRITENSVVDISYDYSMFGSESESTLIGLSSRLDLSDSISFGGSFLYDFTAKGNILPDIRSTPTSLMVGEGDFTIKDLDIDALNLKLNASGEYAISVQDNNTSGKALIDSMDSSVSEDLASLVDENWFHAAPGPPINPLVPTPWRNLEELKWRSYDMQIRDIDPALEIVDGQKQLVMEVNYDATTRSEIAFAQKLSASGYDFSKKLYIDVWIQDNGADADFAIEFASAINEDADGNTILDTEDKDNNGIISPWEDTGQTYLNADFTTSLIGAHNGKLDTEDLNGNGVLDTYEDVRGYISGSKSNYYLVSNGTVLKNVNGWKQVRIPLNVDPSYDSNYWKNIRILRFRIIRNSAESKKIVIGKIAITGNKWEQDGTNAANFEISAIGQSDASYVSLLTNPYYRDLYDLDSSAKKDEQALKIEYNTVGATEDVFAQSVYSGNTLNVSQYENLRFFVYAKDVAVGDFIVFRAGGNDDNYFEYRIPVTADPSWQSWKLITINQTGKGRSAGWQTSDPGAAISVVGTPSLEKVAQLTLGVISTDPGVSHQVWFNEIHVTGSKTIDGAAWKAGGSLRWGGSGAMGAVTAGVSRKSIDRDFQTITAGVYNRDYLEDSAFVEFEGVKTQTLSILPVKAGLSRIRTVTPDVADNSSNLISIYEEGKVVNYTGYAETNLNLGVDLPQISAQYSRSIIDSSEIEQIEDKEIITGSLVYNNPVTFPLLPTTVTANVRTANSYYKVYPSSPIGDSNAFLGLDSVKAYMDLSDYHTLEQADMFSLKLPFKFSKGIVFSPSYLIDKVKEKNHDFPTEVDYDKTLNQTIGASLMLGIVSWFSPTFTYSISTKENYDISSSTDPANLVVPGQKKYIERNGVGEVSWNLNAYDIAATDYIKSLTFSAYYRLQDSDSYDNVGKDFDSIGFAMDKIWIRDNPLMDVLPSYSSSSYIVKSILNRDDIRISGRYLPFEAFKMKGMLSPLNSLSANFTYTEGSENSYVTGTMKDVYTQIWPELLIGMSGIERFFGNIKWMSDTQFNFKYQDKTITTYGVSYGESLMYGFDYRCKIKRKLDLYFSIENTDSAEDDYATLKSITDGISKKWIGQGAIDWGKWRFSLRYENEDAWQTNSLGKYSSQILKNSYLGQVNADMMFPAGIKIPIINKTLPLTNRLIFLSNIKYITQESDINVEQDNNTNYGFAASADYEVSKYFRFILGASWDRYDYTYNADLNYSDLTFSGKLTIQF